MTSDDLIKRFAMETTCCRSNGTTQDEERAEDERNKRSINVCTITITYNGASADFDMALRMESIVDRTMTTNPKPVHTQAASRCRRVFLFKDVPGAGVVKTR